MRERKARERKWKSEKNEKNEKREKRRKKAATKVKKSIRGQLKPDLWLHL